MSKCPSIAFGLSCELAPGHRGLHCGHFPGVTLAVQWANPRKPRKAPKVRASHPAEPDPEPRPPSGRIWACSICGTTGAWGPSWTWYGSWLDFDETGEPTAVMCSADCAKKFNPRSA